MELGVTCSLSVPPLSVLLTGEFVKPDIVLNVAWGKATTLEISNNGVTLNSAIAICRYLARLAPSKGLYGTSVLEKTEVDHWLEFTTKLCSPSEFSQNIKYLNEVFQAPILYLVGQTVTLADVAVWAALYQNNQWQKLLTKGTAPFNLLRWYKFLSSTEPFNAAEQLLPAETQMKMGRISGKDDKKAKSNDKGTKDEGKFVDLPGAEKGKVVIRFPPEASGFLHIGHAKAALLNQYYQNEFEGKLILRFDDTNPAKEKEDFEKVILEDVEMLGIKPNIFSYTSDYFDVLLQSCEDLLKSGKAYVDDTDGETMKVEREERKESKNRNNSVQRNLEMWEEMKKGSKNGQNCCVRAKIDMNADNGCMRDPTLYRCKKETHPRTGNKYNVYPTYDFACPIVDSIENVTHALRTTEYHDRDEQYFWILDALEMRKPYIYEYSRLNMMNTVLSKRKLTWFVEQGIVDGWDDPRMPTVRGVLRQGMTVEGLKQFIIAQGSSRSVVMMDWDKIWAFNKKVIDPISPRFTAVEKDNVVSVIVKDASEEPQQVPKHPKNPDVGMKTVWTGPHIVIDRADAEAMKDGENVTFINWGNLLIKFIKKNSLGQVEQIEATLNLDNKDYKKTLKVTWLANTEKAPLVPCVFIYFDHLITKSILGKDEDFKCFLADTTKTEVMMLGDPEMKKLKKNDIIQVQRKGYFICDQPYDSGSNDSRVVLIFIPDGSKDTNMLPEIVRKAKGIGKNQNKSVTAKAEVVQSSTNKNKDLDDARVKELNDQIKAQGEKVRSLKSEKVDKMVIDAEVQELLKLKADFKIITGKEWKLDTHIKSAEQANQSKSNKKNVNNKEEDECSSENLSGLSLELDKQIKNQGDKIRHMKVEKVSKDVLDPEIQTLLKLKTDFKALTGKEWKPSSSNTSNVKKKEDGKGDCQTKDSATKDQYKDAAGLKAKADAQGEKVRNLKTSGASKQEIESEVKILLDLKAKYKELTGEDLNKGADKRKDKKKEKPEGKQDLNKKQHVKKKEAQDGLEMTQSGLKKITRLGIEAKKEENLADWYSQVITKADMIDYYDISGCYILRPWSFSIWEVIQKFFDAKIKSIGVQNCYFPMFVSAQALEKEKTHVEDFAPEVAWVTRSGNSDLAEPIAIRPTSETVMYPYYAKWIKSHRDLPIQLNQWCNVVRWEFKHPQPFLRTREFLWQEGHSAFATQEEAVKEVYQILEFYAEVYEKLLAIPVIRGRKTEREKFAGGDFTTTVEAYVSASGRGLQGATSHHLGQNFSKMFEVVFEDPETSEKKFVYQNSWGISTRTIGALVMIHSDNVGLVLPPQVACFQVVIIPCGITASLTDADKNDLINKSKDFESMLMESGIRTHCDYRDNYSPGWKFNHWELKGVPLRVELGPRDIKQQQFVAVRRDTGEKMTLKMEEAVVVIKDLLDKIQNSLYQKALDDLNKYLTVSHEWEDFLEKLDNRCIIQSPFCGEGCCEEKIKKDSAKDADELGESSGPAMGAKTLCIPFKQPGEITADLKCIYPSCNNKPKFYTLFGRSY
ncbi:bifunctional glutamate/proline--tRNA ligase-like [Limulus polyphemus]|uniref:Bifunctional glutamate/proline--tRNA ligase-like n=2 Tax=Limulus polyphemus TaxID=6850 RepID=A0ABM1BD56_LIMPO|nr:bifunctional glutamate/proline--tRNA ligase-like [Limulus polyphemus]